MPHEVLTFVEALDDSEYRTGGRNLILGNGFSIYWNPNIFHYASLYEEAKLARLSIEKHELFNSLETHDFEEVIQHLRSAANLVRAYGENSALARRFRRDAKVVQRGLSDVLAERHPLHSYEPTQDEVDHARQFLSKFGRIFTLNYDLLLYWTLNRDAGSPHFVQKGDGFEWPTSSGPRDLVWKRSAAERGQRVFYLHGALHYFVHSDLRLHKVFYDGAPIIDTIRVQIDAGRYPLLVTEGSRREKEARIEKSGYLRYCHQKLQSIDGSLFIHGASLSPNDEHVFRPLESKQSHIEALYVSVFGDFDDENNDELTRVTRSLVKNRAKNGGRKLAVFYYDASSANVWRS